MLSHRLTIEELAQGLDTVRIGRRLHVFDELDSTNTHALEHLRDVGRSADGAVIFTEHQTAGRGRLGRRWQSPRGASLLFTVLLVEPRNRERLHKGGAVRPQPGSADRLRANATRKAHSQLATSESPGRHEPVGSATHQAAAPRLSLLTSVAAAEAIRKATDVEAVIRWPNDLYVGQKKLAGILIETRDWPTGLLATAIGIGVNCLQQPGHFPPDLARPATSLDIESARPVDRAAVARAVIKRLDQLLADMHDPLYTDVHEAWKKLSNDIGQRVTLVESGIEHTGRILDLDPADGLLLQLDTGARRAFYAHSTTRL